VLAPTQATGLTARHRAGKTIGRARSKQGMTTQQTRTPVPCQSPGPRVDVVEWRTCRLRKAGFRPALADALAAQRVDLHALLQLVDAGCPPDLAARILSSADDTGTLS
jgi:hypothetical protein